jgi:ADP-ribose pyrophosphatase YjhB (NUDIX family)
MALRSAPPQVTLVCCTLLGGALAVLVSDGTARGAEALPTRVLGSSEAPDVAAEALRRSLLGRAAAWQGQVGAVRADSTLVIAYVSLVSVGTAPPPGHRWQAVGRGSGAPLVRAAVAHLRDRLDREPIAFHLLGPQFTLSDLQQVYELLLERRLHKASFRRTLLSAHLVEPTDSWRSEGRGRPAQLFRFSPRRRRGVQRAVRFELLG